MTNTIKRGEIYYADLSPVVGSEQGGVRPVLILQNDTGNKFSSTTIVAPITSVPKKRSQPMWRTTIRQLSMPTPSHRCRRNWQGEPQNARSSRSARLQSRANIAENTRSLNCLSVGNARLHTADALGLQTVKRELCGAVSAALTTAKNTVTTHRLWKKPHYRKQS